MGRKLAKVGDKLTQEKFQIREGTTESKAPIKESEALKAAKEVTKVSKDVADAASVAGGSGARASDIRNKFEKGESFLEGDKNKEIKKRKTKIKYAGVGSVKEQFMKEAEKAVNGTPTDGQPRKMKEITPPREGVATGVLESQPAARPEGVVGATVGEQTVTDYIGIGKKTKDVRERFKRLEKTGSMRESQALDPNKKPPRVDEENEEGEEKKSTGVESEELRQVATEATRSAKARWKDIESGKVETTIEKTKIELGNSVSRFIDKWPTPFQLISDWSNRKGPSAANTYAMISQGGIYENEPDKLLDIARQEKEDAPHLVVTTSAAERKNAFLKKAAEESKIKRFDAK
ncbi:hypothetical protein ACTXT7_012367, partial [Hymenolepis weldensis]